jgi:signal transduction histidine kinase
VNVSAEFIAEQIKTSKVGNVSKLSKLMGEHASDLAGFLTGDEKGRRVPEYLEQLAKQLEAEQSGLLNEARALRGNIEHIKEIVSAQQSYAGHCGVVEQVSLQEVLEDALKIQSGAFMRHGVVVTREFETVPAVLTDKHKVLQILINLLQNAKYACDAGANPVKQLTLRLRAIQPDRVRIEISDTGEGIAPENLTRIFSYGFTTRKAGHGFGLHSGALAAKEMGGSLTASSEGPGKGATFMLELPVRDR